jgi:hypothetical protein
MSQRQRQPIAPVPIADVLDRYATEAMKDHIVMYAYEAMDLRKAAAEIRRLEVEVRRLTETEEA